MKRRRMLAGLDFLTPCPYNEQWDGKTTSLHEEKMKYYCHEWRGATGYHRMTYRPRCVWQARSRHHPTNKGGPKVDDTRAVTAATFT